MRRIGNLFSGLTSFENLYAAAQKAIRGSSAKREALRFFFALEPEIIKIRQELRRKTYSPGAYRYFTISEPKKRTISVAPFRDKVVHHALVAALEPIYERQFIYDSYATRKGKGTHRAIARAQRFLKSNPFYLKADIAKYFPSMDHAVLLEILGRKIKDRDVLWLAERIIRNSGEGGLPIGNLTSQFFANVYLDAFDHYIKDRLGRRCYLRYMDDFVVFSNDKSELKRVLAEARRFLKERLALDLKEGQCYINTRMNGLSFLGVRIFPALVRVKSENLRRTMAKLKRSEWQFSKGAISERAYLQSMMSLTGHLASFDTRNLMKNVTKGQLS